MKRLALRLKSSKVSLILIPKACAKAQAFSFLWITHADACWGFGERGEVGQEMQGDSAPCGTTHRDAAAPLLLAHALRE